MKTGIDHYRVNKLVKEYQGYPNLKRPHSGQLYECDERDATFLDNFRNKKRCLNELSELTSEKIFSLTSAQKVR